MAYRSTDTSDGWTQRQVDQESLKGALDAIAEYANENGLRVMSTSILEERADRVGEAQRYGVESRAFEMAPGARGLIVSYVTGVQIAVVFETREG